MQYAKMTPVKIGSSFVGVPAIPLRHAVREVTLTHKQKYVTNNSCKRDVPVFGARVLIPAHTD